MSFLDKMAASIMPAASAEDRAEARRTAEQLSQGNDWLGQVLDHHRQIEAAFERALNEQSADGRRMAAKALEQVLNGHSVAEEAVLYHAVVKHSGKAHATMAYEEQAAAKINFAILDSMDPLSQEWVDKLKHIQSAVQQHVYQEENSWFPDVVRNAPASEQQLLTQQYAEEIERNLGGRKQPAHMSEIA